MFTWRKKQQTSTPTIYDNLYAGLISPLNEAAPSPQLIYDQMLNVARNMRGNSRPPAIFIHGVMPRNGTVYFGEVLRLHPDLFPYPNSLWELPFLAHAGDLVAYQEKFFQTYQQNRERLGANDLLCQFGAGMMNYLHSFVPEEKVLLIKIPRMQFVNYFSTFFPFEKLVLLMRDGRDVVQSTIKTWPNRDFAAVCREWDASTRIYLQFKEQCNELGKVCFVKYEDLLRHPAETAKGVFSQLGMSSERYPDRDVEKLPVRGSSTDQSSGQVSWDPVECQNNFTPGGRWGQWSRQEKDLFKSLCGETLISLDYAEDLSW